MSPQQYDPKLIQILSERLERISADSIWAHRASGLRRSLLRILDEIESEKPPDQKANMIIAMAFRILEGAARQK